MEGCKMEGLNMVKFALFDYVPQRYMKSASFEDVVRNRKILDFKDGKSYAVSWAAKVISTSLSLMDLSNTVVVCIPACCKRTNDRRFKKFSAMMCEQLGSMNGFDYVQVTDKRRNAHIDHVHDIVEGDYVHIDEKYFAGKEVIVVDDIVTSCKTADAFIEMMRLAGAKVRMAVFLAKTKSYKRKSLSYS